MDIDFSDNQKPIIPDINIPVSNVENNNKEDEVIAPQGNKDNEASSQPKLKLKKKLNKLKKPENINNDNNIEENIEVPNIEINVFNNGDNNDIDINNNDNKDNIEIKAEDNLKNEDNEEKNEINKGYLDDDLEDEENKKLYLRVIKRMEKTYNVPVISADIPGEPIEDIGLEENIRPILVGKTEKTKKNVYNNNFLEDSYKNNLNNIQNKINNNNIYNSPNKKINYNNITNNKENRPYINNSINNNNNNLLNSQKLNYNYNSYINNYKPKEYIINPNLYNKSINNSGIYNKYKYMNMNYKIPRKYSYEKPDINSQNRLNKKYPIYDPNKIDFRTNNINFKNLKYYNIGNEINLNQRKYNYPLKKTYFISYNNKYTPISNLSNLKPTKNRNYFNTIQLNNNRSPNIPKTNFKYSKENNNNIYNNFVKNYKNSIQLYNSQKFPNDIIPNKIKNIHINKSQNIPRRNPLYNYTGSLYKNNYYPKYNRNLLSQTQEVMNYSNKKANNKLFKSYNNYNLNFNYEDNINDNYNPAIKNQRKDIKVTYFINSRYN